MGEPLLTALSIENYHHHPSTLLTMDPTGQHLSNPIDCARSLLIQSEISMPSPVDINQPVYIERSPPPLANQWSSDTCDMLDVGLGPQIFEPKSTTSTNSNNSGSSNSRKCAKRGDSIWGAWFFFNYYFKPVLSEKSKGKTITRDSTGFSGYSKSDLNVDVFLVQHDMENMYMWVFKERPENALGKMQLRSFMNGHSRLGEPQFPFSVDKGFVRSHRMQRKHYRGLSNPQCLHGIEIVRNPMLTSVNESDLKKWFELTGREVNFLVPVDASDFESWRNLPSTDFELDRSTPALIKNGNNNNNNTNNNNSNNNNKKHLNGSGLNLSTHNPNNSIQEMEVTPMCSTKRRKEYSPHAMEEDLNQDLNQELNHLTQFEPPWLNDFSGVMRHAAGPVTASKSIYEDEEGYLIMVSLPYTDLQRVKVSWRNTLTYGVVKISCVSVGRLPFVKRHDRTFKLSDNNPEHCPPGEFVREICLGTRIPEDAKLEAYYDETGTGLEIMVPKFRVGQEEHEVHVSMRPPQSWT